MNSKFLKGLLLAIIGASVPYLEVTPIDWALVIVMSIGAILVYTGKNSINILKSKSKKWSLDFINIISSLIIAIGNAIVSAGATLVINGNINWGLIATTAISSASAYILGTFSEGNKK